MQKVKLIIAVLCLVFILPQAHTQTQNDEERNPIIKTDTSIFGLSEQLDISAGFDVGFSDVFWQNLGVRMDYTAGPFTLTGEISFLNDQKYAPAAAMVPAGDVGGFYFMLVEGGLSYRQGPLQFDAGRYRNYDQINSPYSLFINSDGISSNTFRFRWETNNFIYHTQWIQLNWNSGVSSPAWNEYQRRRQNGNQFLTPSPQYENDPNNPSTDGLLSYGFPDRGMNLKLYGIKLNDMRFGYMEAAVYSQRPFDLDYFLIPLPVYFIQYFRTTEGRPWATGMNDKTFMGLFWEIEKDEWDAYAQVLIGDVSLSFLNVFFGYERFSPNPWKAAWTLGGRMQTSIGTFGFHHAGALKYTFNPIGTDRSGRYAWDSANTAYGYTYYPETRYFDGSRTVNLLIQDNMIGYKHGENNLAFQIDYQNTFNNFLVTSELEFLLAGNNSPANPWHDYDARASMYDDGRKGSQIFGDGQIEKRIELRINVSRQFGPIGVYAALAVGGRFNMLELVPPDEDTHFHYEPTQERTVDNDIWIWKASGNHEPIFRISIGFRYLFPIL